MRYNVSQLLKGHVGETRHYQLQNEIAELDPTIRPLTALNGTVDLIRTNEGILVRANLYTTVELTCSRCLTEFGFPARFEIDDEFYPTIDILTGARLPLPAEADAATLIDAHHLLDLSEITRQDLTLALPLAPLCRNNCQGLCPICGKNRNNTACEHPNAEIDPRFAKLQDLLDESNRSSQ
ncbi:MAG: hypothetical protein B6D41_21115 [Chloroflexi bacterium UTCFX4]|nr:MAG: hypothetical protein B6D41_21115 [Chloroflexi bacterium UTCFX4]